MGHKHAENTDNGNALLKLGYIDSGLQGRTTQLPIYGIEYVTFSGSSLAPADIDQIVASIENFDGANPNWQSVAASKYRGDHRDDLGNLPDAPANGGTVYTEFTLDDSGFPTKKLPRLLADLHNRRLFITPTHYETWLISRKDGERTADTVLIEPVLGKSNNPFILLRNVNNVNNLFD